MSVSDIKITILGASMAGKTCYLLGMYGEMQMGKHGFTLSACSSEDDLQLSTLWDRLLVQAGETRWPTTTIENPRTYKFEFSYGFKPLMQFEWLDYRGEALSGESTGADTVALQNHLLNSSCILLSISGEYFSQPVDEAQLTLLARKAKVNFMSRYLVDLSKAVQPTNQAPFPVVILITKYDLCHARKKDLIEDLKQIFEPLFTPESGWLVLICPVSLGKELAENRDTGKIDPKNLHLPLIFSLYFKLQNHLLAEQRRAETIRANLAALKQDGLFTHWRNGSEIRALEKNLESIQVELESVQSKMALVAQELSQAQIYLSGREIQVDI